MKVGLVSTWKQKCGIATYTAFLGEELQKLGVDVHILAEKQGVVPNSFDPNFNSNLPSTECWSRHEKPDMLLETVKKEKLDIVHIQHQFGLFPYEQSLTYLLQSLKMLGVATVVTLHDVIGFNPYMETYFNSIVKNSDKLIVHTDVCQRLLMRVWKCPTNKICLIPHGTKIIKTPTKQSARKTLGLPLDAEIILSWGFIWESKGILELVDVLGELRKTYPNVMLIHAGGLHPAINKQGYLKRIFKKAMQLGIDPSHFMVTGFVTEEQLRQYFGACDLIVLNYMRGSASASGAAHRALGCGRPIVGTDDMCIEEIPKQTVPRGDIQGLYKGIKKVLEDKNLQKKLVEWGEKVAKETSWENVAKQHKKVYDSFRA